MAAHTPVCGRANILDVVDPGEIYLTFVFDGIDSTTAGVSSVTNSGTYDTPILPTYNDNSLDVDGYDGKYYFNTRLMEKSFSYYCFIDNLSANEYEQLKAWLHPKKIGKLIRPEEPYKYYWVKVSSVDNLQNIPLKHPDTGGVSYTGFFNVTFTTLGQACGYLAEGIFYKGDLAYYEYGNLYRSNVVIGTINSKEPTNLDLTRRANEIMATKMLRIGWTIVDEKGNGWSCTNVERGTWSNIGNMVAAEREWGYYDAGLLYREECLPMSFTYSTGNYNLNLYNPGTYQSKLKLILKAKRKITVPEEGNEEDYFLMITNKDTGDVSNIILGNKTDPIQAGEVISIDWGNNEYKRMKVDGTEQNFANKVRGDLIFTRGRTFVEKFDGAAVTESGGTLEVHLDPAVRLVRQSDIGKVIMYKNPDAGSAFTSDGAGGRIIGINTTLNYYILDSSATGNASENTSITIAEEDDIVLAISSSAELDATWGLQVRYL